jgi:hypothetical protein
MVRYLAESLTDYLIKYSGVTLKYGKAPQYEEEGVADLLVDLQEWKSTNVNFITMAFGLL